MNLPLRAHHGLCFLFFQGRGYDKKFTENMKRVQTVLLGNPQIKIMHQADVLCRCCPYLQNGQCVSFEKVFNLDQAVMTVCHLQDGMELSWETFSRRVFENIILSGKRQEICKNCEWAAFCEIQEQCLLKKVQKTKAYFQ